MDIRNDWTIINRSDSSNRRIGQEKESTSQSFAGSLQRLNWQKNKAMVRLFAGILVFFLGMTFLSMNMHTVKGAATDVASVANTTALNYAEEYAGIFSTAVTTSVNPTATMAVLSILGMVENSDTYFPKATWLVTVGNFLTGVPIVRSMSGLPIANPVAAIVLSVVTIALYVLRSIKTTKAISEVSVDKIESVLGYIAMVGMSLMPVITTTAQAAEEGMRYVSPAFFVLLAFVGAGSALINSAIYTIVNQCVDYIETIATCLPVKGANLVVEILKSVLHFILVLVQIFAPVLSVILSVIVVLISALVFFQLQRLATYYDYIYLRPLWRRLFHKYDAVELVHKKFPRRARKKYYPDEPMAIPAFTMRQYGNILKVRELLWLLAREDGPILVRLRPFGKPKEVPVATLNRENQPLYLQKDARFFRLRTEDRHVEIIFSKEYEKEWEGLLEVLGAEDYQVVVDRKKAEKEAKAEERRSKREIRAAERAAKWEEKRANFTMPWEKRAKL